MKIILFVSSILLLFLNGLLARQQYTTDYYIDNTINDTVYYKADVMPKYKNGDMDFLIDFLQLIKSQNNVDELNKALSISFVITKNGIPVNCKIEKCEDSYLAEDYENKIITAIEGMIGWNNGSIKGKAVNVYIQKKVYFHFQ